MATKMETEPHVIVVGGGPAGLLASLALSRNHVRSTVLERSPEPDQWGTKSYSININEKGRSALDAGGVLRQVVGVASQRRARSIFDKDGNNTVIPNDPPNIAMSRPGLVECLENVCADAENLEIRRGVGVVRVEVLGDEGGSTGICVHLEDGSDILGSHVIGADGKWSAVRRSIPMLEDNFRIRTEPSFGVHIMAPSVPDCWGTDVTNVFRPRTEAKFYIIAAPLPSGECSISIVCYDETLEMFPWMKPREGSSAEAAGWENEFSAMPNNSSYDRNLAHQLEEMLQIEMPLFLEALGTEPLQTARINRRVSWVEARCADEVSYCSKDGRVALIGDAAHAVTPSIGQGCNIALESAIMLCQKYLAVGMRPPSVSDISKAFKTYGEMRPKEVLPIQVASATNSRLKSAFSSKPQGKK